MNWFEASAIAIKNRIHIRRESWPSNKWIFCGMEPIWIVFPNPDPTGKTQQVVRCTDFGAEEFLADDWTTVPAPLVSCPVTPTEPSGGGPPTPGFPGFPPGPPPGFPPPPGGGGGGGSPPGSLPPLPTPDPGTGLTITFSGIQVISSPNYPNFHTGDLDGPVELEPAGPGTWTGTINAGAFQPIDPSTGDPVGDAINFVWNVKVTKAGGLFGASMTCTTLGASGGFGEVSPVGIGQTMHNVKSGPAYGSVYGGTAVVG